MKIRDATEADVPLILQFIRDLARYEKLEQKVIATEAGLRQSLFGNPRFAEVIFACVDDVEVGFALFFHNFSTWTGKPGIYLEDIFIRPEHRRKGYGSALMRELGRLAIERGCGRLEWAVLDWNEPAISFYRALGATALDEWTTYRIAGEALAALGRNPGAQTA